MNRMIHFDRYLYIASLCLLTAACSDDTPQTSGPETDGLVALQLGSLSIENPVQTRTDIAIPAGSVIGIGTAKTAADDGTTLFANQPYSLNKEQKWSPLSPENTVYLGSQAVNLYIYYPWIQPILGTDGGTGFQIGKNVYQTQARPYSQRNDVCFAQIASVDAQTVIPATTLNHIHTRWKFKIKRNNYPGEGKVSFITFSHVKQNYHFNPATQNWSEITISGASSSSGEYINQILPTTGEAIEVADWLVPAYTNCISEISIRIDNHEYPLPAATLSKLPYTQGTCYEMTLVLNGKELALGTMTINDWDAKTESEVTPTWPSPTL